MNASPTTKSINANSPRTSAKFVGVYYLTTILMGVFVLLFHGRMVFAADLAVCAFYLTLTALFYGASSSRTGR